MRPVLQALACVVAAVVCLSSGCSRESTEIREPPPSAGASEAAATETPNHHPALGDVRHASPELAPYLDGRRFEPKRSPRPGEWLAEHQERGQSFGHYAIGNPNRVDEQRNTIYVQPFGEFPEHAPSLASLELFTADYFQVPVRVLPQRVLEDMGLTTRRNPHSGQEQVLTDDLLAALRDTLPEDAFCLLGITMVDLYPGDDWNFVFGQALLHGRVGVYSFARHVSDDPVVTLRRGLKILAHETGHMFSIEHCIHYECVMNGSNHLDEADSQPMHLCPVCLRKLHHAVGFDPTERYQALGARYASFGMHPEVRWIREALQAGSDPKR
jgi:archaemetzincin